MDKGGFLKAEKLGFLRLGRTLRYLHLHLNREEVEEIREWRGMAGA